jgi:hypothetical protein
MSSSLTPPERSACEAVGELLAWHANGTLGAADRATVDSHTAACETCRTSLAIERRIVEAMREPRDNVEQAPHAGWQKLLTRLDAEEARAAADREANANVPIPSNIAADTLQELPGTGTRRGRVNWPAALGAAVAVQAAAIAVLTVALVRHRQTEQAPRFHTLSNVDPTLAADGSLVRIAFDATVDEAAARSVADQSAARILAGPSPDNVYTFVFRSGTDAGRDLDEKVSELRRRAHVLLVEPVIVGTSRKDQ